MWHVSYCTPPKAKITFLAYTGTKRASNRKEKTLDCVCFCTTPVVRYLFEKSMLKSGGNILVVTVEKHRLVAKPWKFYIYVDHTPV